MQSGRRNLARVFFPPDADSTSTRQQPQAPRGHRLILTQAVGRGGSYYYFLCRGRQEGLCDLPYLRADDVEAAVEREYANLGLPADFAGTVEAEIEAALTDEQRTTGLLQANLAAELQRLSAAEERLIDLAAEGALPAGKVRSRLTKIAQDQERIRAELEGVEDTLHQGAAGLGAALTLLERPQELYRQAGGPTRRLLNQTFYERLWVDLHDVTGVVYHRPFGDLRDAATTWGAVYLGDEVAEAERTRTLSAVSAEGPSGCLADLLASVSLDPGSSKTVMVGEVGLEPTRLLRPADFKSAAYTNSATRPGNVLNKTNYSRAASCLGEVITLSISASRQGSPVIELRAMTGLLRADA